MLICVIMTGILLYRTFVPRHGYFLLDRASKVCAVSGWLEDQFEVTWYDWATPTRILSLRNSSLYISAIPSKESREIVSQDVGSSATALFSVAKLYDPDVFYSILSPQKKSILVPNTIIVDGARQINTLNTVKLSDGMTRTFPYHGDQPALCWINEYRFVAVEVKDGSISYSVYSTDPNTPSIKFDWPLHCSSNDWVTVGSTPSGNLVAIVAHGGAVADIVETKMSSAKPKFVQTPISFPEMGLIEGADLSPDGTNIVWQFGVNNSLLPVYIFQQADTCLWISTADGHNLRRIGYLPMSTWDNNLICLRWRNNREVSFIYREALYQLPVY